MTVLPVVVALSIMYALAFTSIDEAASPSSLSTTVDYDVVTHIRKCCPLEEVFRNNECGRAPTTFTLTWFLSRRNGTRFQRINGDEKVALTVQKCQHFREEKLPEEFYVFQNGTYSDRNRTVEDFCLEYVEEWNTVVPVICEEQQQQQQHQRGKGQLSFLDNLMTTARATSAIFMCLTLVIYAIIHELRNVQGKCLMCYILCLIVRDVFLCFIYNLRESSVAFQIAVDIMRYVAISSLFWLHIMTFDLWWNIGRHQISNRAIKPENSGKLLAYCAYAWGCPMLIMLATFLMKYLLELPNKIVYPNYRLQMLRCGFTDGYNTFLCYNVFCFGLLGSNLIMFCLTTKKLRLHRKQTKVLQQNRILNKEQQRFVLYVKLFIVMGVDWLIYIVVNTVVHHAGGPVEVQQFTGVAASLHGIIRFQIFICKRRILTLLKKALFS